MVDGIRLPEEWRAVITAWARCYPRIDTIHVFGSRAKGTSRGDSDLDLAVTLSEEANDTALGHSIFKGPQMHAALAAVLPVPVDLQFASEGDVIVGPAVREHGVLIYSRDDR